jgi:hypothetical protein
VTRTVCPVRHLDVRECPALRFAMPQMPGGPIQPVIFSAPSSRLLSFTSPLATAQQRRPRPIFATNAEMFRRILRAP